MKVFHILFNGCASSKFVSLLSEVKKKNNYKFSFIVLSKRDVKLLLKNGILSTDIYCLSEGKVKEPNLKDIEYLSFLEQQKDVLTIHNMIMSDRVVSKLKYSEGIAYASYLANKFKCLYKEILPSVVIGGHDAMHSAIGCAIAKAESIPWFSLNFSTLPSGYIALSLGVIPNEMVLLQEREERSLCSLAEKSLSDFENKQVKTLAYISAYNIKEVIQRFPKQLLAGFCVFKTMLFNNFNKYAGYDFAFIFKQYFRKRMNLLTLPKKWLIKQPPQSPFVFFGLHMQPESSIDVYSPFYSNQFDIIEKIARSIPP
ncbi:MAG: hypothetical protein PHY59_09070, partial [Methanobacterium sp.]|nr:hypothetical protein [Methanobacterium sp.]